MARLAGTATASVAANASSAATGPAHTHTAPNAMDETNLPSAATVWVSAIVVLRRPSSATSPLAAASSPSVVA